MSYIFKLVDKLLRFFGYCFVFEVDNSDNRYEVKNIFIKKSYK